MFTQEGARAMEPEDGALERADMLLEERALRVLQMREEDRAQDDQQVEEKAHIILERRAQELIYDEEERDQERQAQDSNREQVVERTMTVSRWWRGSVP